jgi:hypothetical protein
MKVIFQNDIEILYPYFITRASIGYLKFYSIPRVSQCYVVVRRSSHKTDEQTSNLGCV